MAALNFPSPAADGDIYQGTNGVTYIYISDGLGGGYWSGASGASNEAPNIDIGNDPPPFPKEGDLWWDSTVTSGRLYVYYKDGDSEQWVETSPMGGEDPQDDLWKKLGSELSPSESTDNVVIGGGDITLNANGSAEFKSSGYFGGSSSDYGILLAANGNLVLKYRGAIPTGTEGNFIGFSSNLGQTATIKGVNTNGGLNLGKLLFMLPQGNTSADNVVLSLEPDGSSQFTGDVLIGGTPPSAPNIQLNADGNIYAAGGSFEVANNGRVDIYRRTGTGTNTALEVFSDVNSVKDSKFKLYADGSATFKGRVSAGDITGNYGMTVIAGGEITSNYGVFVATHEKSGGSLFVGQNGAGQVNARIKEDGSASFAGPVTCNFVSVDSPVSGTSQKLSNWTSASTNDAVVFWANGSAEFKGAVTPNALLFNLEADDDTKYTSTTDADGNETRVYNGETLDVKELLLTLRTAASRIETLETAKASLEARLTALEGAN